ncbi:substrate-binding periplasmic protein [Azospirillum thermophilum]|uniref:Amino acid ABC transporter substrate-binding protein n=1 Tax=Azospirillum thermophilum TaxID=2202148 RepID=A0A2S2CQZ8_9PROT|nr:transporter substrate-binding domain-containing protein [Azospirillum thermophilum]AWK86717.1 amino acid ABC transporter substrate-binding protein [Azospirillum thermophilum]
MAGRRGIIGLAGRFTAALWLAAAFPGAAAAQVAPLESPLQLVTGNDFPPLTGEELPQGGLMSELVVRAFRAVGLNYEVRFMPWKRGYDAVVAGRYLGTFPYVRTPEREREVLFSDPVLVVRQLVYLSVRTGMQFRSPADFRGRTVCSPVGYALPAELAVMVRNGELQQDSPADLNACARMVASGRADAFVLDEHSGQAAVERAGVLGDIRVADRPFAMAPQHLVVSRTIPEGAAVLAAFNAGLKKLKDSGAFDEIVARHAPRPAPPPAPQPVR